MVDTRHKIRYQKPCSTCGQIFGAWNQNQKYCCDDCKQKGKAKVHTEYQAKKKTEVRTKKKKQLTIGEIDAAAREAGMNYGQLRV